MIFTDTHCHLYLKEFDDDRSVVIEKSIEKGIKHLFLPNIDSLTIKPMLDLTNKYPDNCFPMMGLHPTSVKANYKEEMEVVEKYLQEGKFCGVGEAGIDLYWDKTYKEEQIVVFRHHIELAKQYNLPLIIHSRNSMKEVFCVMDDMIDNNLRGIFHCFPGSVADAKKVIGYGFKIGIGGVVTFKNSGFDKIVQEIDLKHIVLETDSPYLAPAPKRGKRNESSYLFYIADKIAQIHNVSIDKVAKTTTQNAKEVFGF